MSPGRRSRPSEDDVAEWAQYARQVMPLPGRVPPNPPPAKAAAPPRPAPVATAAQTPAPRAAVPPVVVGLAPAGLDRAMWERFRTGKLPTARTLDLHGRTVQRSFHALDAFLRAAHADRLRCVEVITGRGGGGEGGALRRELPSWLNLPSIRPMILAAAHPHPANPGAVRLLLRRVR